MLKRHSLAIVLILFVSIIIGTASFAAVNNEKNTAEAKQVVKKKSAKPAEDDFLASLDLKEEKQAEVKEAPLYITALSFIFKLALVLGLAYLTILGLKKFTNMKGTFAGGSQRIRVIENSSLGANRSLHLVEIGSRKLLIASTPNQVNLLTEVDPADLPEIDLPDPQIGFKEQFLAFLGQNKADASKSAGNVAEMLRNSSSKIQNSVRELGKIRGSIRGNENE